MKNTVPNQLNGFTLIEALVATLLASVMSISVISIYVNQTNSINTESQRDANTLESNRAFDIVTRLLRQAEQSSIELTYTSPSLNGVTLEKTNDDIQIDFQLPAGFNVWPNNIAPFANNFVRILWENSSIDNKHLIRVRNAPDLANLANAEDLIIAGNNSGEEARIINLDVWPMIDQTTEAINVNAAPDSGYFVSLTTRTANADYSYTNPLDPEGDLENYRTLTASGIVAPRN